MDDAPISDNLESILEHLNKQTFVSTEDLLKFFFEYQAELLKHWAKDLNDKERGLNDWVIKALKERVFPTLPPPREEAEQTLPLKRGRGRPPKYPLRHG
jgi:hypothetical protein